ncbi:hypothetical protein CLU79DRAFT_692071 [Phycomyces nitens]|nr:hypothetical protein CLU79DRAFT_692071 [Phycomyces nitens]
MDDFEPTLYTYPTYHYSIHDGDDVILESAEDCLSASCVAEWLGRFPSATATLTLDGDTIDIPVYALRRRNAVVAALPDAPLMA